MGHPRNIEICLWISVFSLVIALLSTVGVVTVVPTITWLVAAALFYVLAKII